MNNFGINCEHFSYSQIKNKKCLEKLRRIFIPSMHVLYVSSTKSFALHFEVIKYN